MKIAVFADAASVNVRSWMAALKQAGTTPELLSFAPSCDPGLHVHQLGPGKNSLGKSAYLVGAPQARRITRRLQPDLVIGYYATGYGTLATLAGGYPTVQVAVGNDVLVNPPGTLTHRFARFNLRHADLVVAWAPHLAEAVSAFGVEAERIFVLPRGIDVDRFPIRETRPDTASVRIISTRALDPYYQNHILIEALARVPGPALTFAGDGSERRSLELLAARLGLADRVRFVGVIPNDDLPTVLAEHDIYITATPTDGVSASLLEAMAVGLLPILPDSDANRQWITSGQTGLLVDAADPTSFAAAIQAATTGRILRDHCRVANRRLVTERANLECNTRLFVERFEELIVRRGARADHSRLRRLRAHTPAPRDLACQAPDDTLDQIPVRDAHANEAC